MAGTGTGTRGVTSGGASQATSSATAASAALAASLRTTHAIVQEQIDANEGVTRERFRVVAEKYSRLADDVRLPTLDRKLYSKYILANPSKENLYKLCLLVKVLIRHKAETMTVLSLIQRRESIVVQFLQLAQMYSDGQLDTRSCQSRVTDLLIDLRRVTLRLVDGIRTWRGSLTRPYAFPYRGLDYLLKVQIDNYLLSHSDLAAVIPLQLDRFPLASHLPVLASEDGAMWANHVAYPLQSSRKAKKSASQAAMSAMKAAEAYIHDEQSRQIQLLRDLVTTASDGYFVPVLNTPAVVPRCDRGIQVQSSGHDWLERHRETLIKQLEFTALPLAALAESIQPMEQTESELSFTSDEEDGNDEGNEDDDDADADNDSEDEEEEEEEL